MSLPDFAQIVCANNSLPNAWYCQINGYTHVSGSLRRLQECNFLKRESVIDSRPRCLYCVRHFKANTKDYLLTIWSTSDRYTKICHPPHTKLEADPCNTVLFLTSGPAPSALMSRAPASHCDFCLLPFILDWLSLLQLMSTGSRDYVTTMSAATWRRVRGVSGWQDDTMDARIQWPLFLKQYIYIYLKGRGQYSTQWRK